MFGKYIKSKRINFGIGLRQFAKMLDVSPAFITCIEQGSAKPSEQNIIKIAKIFNVDEDELLARAGKVSSEIEIYMKQNPREFAILLKSIKKEEK